MKYLCQTKSLQHQKQAGDKMLIGAGEF